MMGQPTVDVDKLETEMVAHYANGVHGPYYRSLASTIVMDTVIDADWIVFLKHRSKMVGLFK